MTGLALFYLACFAACAVPSIVRIRRRGTSSDLSVWREWLVLLGVSVQLVVMLSAGVPWQVWISPVLSFTSVSVLLGHIYWYRDKIVLITGGQSNDLAKIESGPGSSFLAARR